MSLLASAAYSTTTAAPILINQTLTNQILINQTSFGPDLSSAREYVVLKQEKEEDGAECGGGGVSAFTFLNFIISSVSLAASTVSNVNSNSNNNNNNNNDNNNNDNNVNVGNTNNNANSQNTIMFLPMIGRKKRSVSDVSECSHLSLVKFGLRALGLFNQIANCNSNSNSIGNNNNNNNNSSNNNNNNVRNAEERRQCVERAFCRAESDTASIADPIEVVLVHHLNQGALEHLGIAREDIECS